MKLDCRGLEFVQFKADVSLKGIQPPDVVLIGCQGEWKAKALEGPTTFSGIDLQEGEWFDYDEKAGDEVSVKDIKWEIRRA